MSETYTIRNAGVKDRCAKAVINVLACDPPQYDVVIKKHVRSKTGQQRNYFHKILELVCNHTGEHLEDLKMDIKLRVLPLRIVTYNGQNVPYPMSSEKATVQQYGELIEAAMMYAHAAEVTIPPASFYGYKI